MNTIRSSFRCPSLIIVFASVVMALAVCSAQAQEDVVLKAARLFDGFELREDSAILVADGRIQKVGKASSFQHPSATVIDLGDSTLLPGFIELHAHLHFAGIPARKVLEHGITTLRDLGGPVHAPSGGQGELRILTVGRILTAPSGYPIPLLGEHGIALGLDSEAEARQAVRDLVAGGAVAIKVALEPGGETGAPHSSGHGHEHSPPNHSQHSPDSDASATAHRNKTHPESGAVSGWPLPSLSIVKAIVDEAHGHDLAVVAHVGEARGVAIALKARVDEWAHIPCDPVPKQLLERAVDQGVKIVTTIDTFSKCEGIEHNTSTLATLGAEFLYGAEIAHPDIPWGIDAQELLYMSRYAQMPPLEVLQTVTSKAGRHLAIPQLGTLAPGAPADIIAVKGNPLDSFKLLEYPDLVMSGGEIIINRY